MQPLKLKVMVPTVIVQIGQQRDFKTMSSLIILKQFARNEVMLPFCSLVLPGTHVNETMKLKFAERFLSQY